MICNDSCHIWWFAAFSSGATRSQTFCFDKRFSFSKAFPGIAVNFSIDIPGAQRMNPDDFCQLHLRRETSKHLTDWQTLCKDIHGFQMLTFSVPTPQGWHSGALALQLLGGMYMLIYRFMSKFVKGEAENTNTITQHQYVLLNDNITHLQILILSMWYCGNES